MLFNSFEFFVFLPVIYWIYWRMSSKPIAWQNSALLVASYFFYGWWSWGFMGLLLLSTLLDFFYGKKVADPNPKTSRFFLILSVINNLGILGVFKYYNFFAAEFATGLGAFGFKVDPILLDIALPVGISFYTFHGMSYVFDIYRKKQLPIDSFVDYAVFVSFFPLLVAGPIERANHLLPQIQQKRFFNYKQSIQGCRLILWGMVKKVVIADQLALHVDRIFNDHTAFHPLTLGIGAIAFAIQIYGDFSGYSDIALGTAKLFGFELLSNFRFPYFSRDIAEFWRRWHISLSSWFRDYLYIPLGGSKFGKQKAIRNTFIIFLVSGFWHGASWNFIFWGGLHAVFFIPLLIMKKNRTHIHETVAFDRNLPNFKEFIQMSSTFLLVTIGWIFFRAHNMEQGIDYLSRMLFLREDTGNKTLELSDLTGIFMRISFLLMTDWWLRRDERALRIIKPFYLRWTIYLTAAVWVIYELILNHHESFLYFQF